MLKWYTFKELSEISGIPEQQLRDFTRLNGRRRLISEKIGNAERTTDEEFIRFSRELLYGKQDAKFVNTFRMQAVQENELLKNIKESL